MPKQWHLLSSLTQTRFDAKSERVVRLDSRCAVQGLSDVVPELLEAFRELSDVVRELSDFVQELSEAVRELLDSVR